MNKDIFFYLLQNRIFIDSLTNDEIEQIYKFFKHCHKERNINSFLGTIEYLIRR